MSPFEKSDNAWAFNELLALASLRRFYKLPSLYSFIIIKFACLTSIKNNIYSSLCYCSILSCLDALKGTWSRFFEFTYRQQKTLPTWHKFHCLSTVIFSNCIFFIFAQMRLNTGYSNYATLNAFNLKTFEITLEHSGPTRLICRSFSFWPEISTERVQEHRNYFYTTQRTKKFYTSTSVPVSLSNLINLYCH